MVCEGFDLCSQCKEKGNHAVEYPDHEMRRVTESKAYHSGVSCDVCEVYPIGGVRYKCTVCDDYDLCSKCKQIGSHPQHKMKRITKIELHRAWDELRINPSRQITVPSDFKVFGKLNVRLPFGKRYFLLKLQSFVRKDMYSEILHLLNGVWFLNETFEYKVLAIDLDGALQVKFDIPIHVSQIHAPKSSDSEHVESIVRVTALQLAIISKSTESIRAIMEYMLRRKTRSGKSVP